MLDNYFWVVVFLSLVGPIVGSFLGVFRRPSEQFMNLMLAFAAGVMLSVAFLQLIPESVLLGGVWFCLVGILGGLFFMFVLDKGVPHVHPGLCSSEHGSKLNKTAMYLFLGIFLHHFPEGMAMGVGLVGSFGASITVALAIALHDIPEGICTSAPYYYLSGKRLKAFLLSSLTALPTLFGFLLTYFLYGLIPLDLVGLLVAGTAGLMIYISADELIPFSCSVNSDHRSIFSFFAGVLIVTLLAYY